MNKRIISGLLVSAGFSERMGQFKPLMHYNGKSFVVTIAEKLSEVCNRVVIVTGFQDEKIEEEINSQFSSVSGGFSSQLLERIKCAYNPNFVQGMFSSLQAGLKELKNSDWILYHFVDQPFHEEKFYNELVAQIDDNYDWVQPCYEGKEGHPVLFSKNIFKDIINSSPNSSLKKIKEENNVKIKRWECIYSAILKDFDYKEDIKKFLA